MIERGGHIGQRRLVKDVSNTAPDTRARYNYQDECLARRIILNLKNGDARHFVVEWSTDYAVIAQNDSVELVSVKHRDPNQGEWTVGELRKQDVIRGLYDAWNLQGRDATCLFESNAGFQGAPARALLRACSTVDSHSIANATPHLARLIDVSHDEARTFLGQLILRPMPLPRRNEITDVAIRELEVALRNLGYSDRFASKCYETLLEKISEVSTNRPATPQERLARLGGMARKGPRDDSEYQSHVIDLQVVRQLLREICAGEIPVAHPKTTGLFDSAAISRERLHNPLFVGRQQELELLGRHLKPGEHEPVAPVVLTGLAGSGKTTIAREFAATNSDSFHTVLINATDEGSVLEGIGAVAPRHEARPLSGQIGPSPFELNPGEIPADSHLLIIVDGIDDPNAIIGIIPKRGYARIVITTTSRHVDDAYVHIIVGDWSRQESAEYLSKVLPMFKTEDCQAVASTLSDFPLAIATAANYMACEGLTADDYLHRLAKAPLPTLDLGKDSNHGESLLKVLNLSLGKVRATDRLANDLLALLAQFGDAPVPEEIFDEPRTIFPTLHCRRGQQDSRRAKHKRAKLSAASFALHDKFRDPIDRDSAVRVLHRYSLVRREQHGFVIHSLVARVIRDQQKSWGAEFYPLAAMGLVMPKLMRWHADPSSVDPVLAHLQSIADRANLLNYDSPAFSAIYSVLGRRLSQLGFHDRALLNSNMAVTLADRLAPISADYRGMYVQARVMHVMVLVSVGEPQEAARQMREIIDRTRRAYNHESMHFFYRILASAQLRAHDPIAAEVTLAELDSYVAGSREPLAGIERIEVLVLRAWVLRLTGKSRSALKLMRDARSLAGEAGASDFDEVSILREEGSLERETGDLTGAIRTQKLLIGRLEDRNIGIDLDLLLSVDHLANLEIEAGLLDASEETCGRAAELARSLLGEEHIYYGQILTTRGRLELVRGQHAHAIRNLTAGISRIEAGAQSPVDLAPAYFHLARGYTEVGQFSEAVDAAKKCLEIDTRKYGENHWEIAEDLIMLAQIHLRVGNLSAARECVLRCRVIPLPSEGRSDLRSLVSSMLFAFEK